MRLGLLALALLVAGTAAPGLAQEVTLMTSELNSPSSLSEELASEPPPDMSRSEALSTELPAEPAAQPIASRDILQAFYDVCVDVASGDPEAVDRSQGAGWQAGDSEDGGPFRTIYSGFRLFAGYDQASFRALTDEFPSQRLGYCSGSIGDINAAIDLNDFTSVAGLTGKSIVEDGYVFGSWETPDHRIMVFATQSEGYVDFEFNLLLGPAPAP